MLPEYDEIRATIAQACRTLGELDITKEALGHISRRIGNSVEHATLRTLSLDGTCTMMYKAYLLGNPKPVLPEDIEDRMQPPQENRPRGNAGGRVGMLSRWRYYVALTEEKAGSGG